MLVALVAAVGVAVLLAAAALVVLALPDAAWLPPDDEPLPGVMVVVDAGVAAAAVVLDAGMADIAGPMPVTTVVDGAAAVTAPPAGTFKVGPAEVIAALPVADGIVAADPLAAMAAVLPVAGVIPCVVPPDAEDELAAMPVAADPAGVAAVFPITGAAAEPWLPVAAGAACVAGAAAFAVLGEPDAGVVVDGEIVLGAAVGAGVGVGLEAGTGAVADAVPVAEVVVTVVFVLAGSPAEV